jgi:hypothetical protein
MPSELFRDQSVFELRLHTSEESLPGLIDIASFLYDFNLLYEISRLAVDPKYRNFKFSRYVYFRNGRPIDPEDSLYVQKLILESPLDVALWGEVSVEALGALYTLILAIERVANFSLSREKLRLEVGKLRAEESARTAPNTHILGMTQRG